jgi:hypothetical protein
MEYWNQASRVKPSGQHPSLLNPIFSNSNAIFHLFPKLPTELRDMIWEQSLTCEPYIEVELCTVDETTGVIRRKGTLGKIRPVTEPYRILLRHPPKPSALFSASVESRASAKRFYRIVLPCFYVTESSSIIDSLQITEQNAERNPQGILLTHVPSFGPGTPDQPQALIPGTLSLNPELDTLEIRGLHQFTNFASDVWHHDPRKAGLCNVAFSQSFILGHSFRRLTRYVSSTDRLRQVVARLRSVTFIHYTCMDRVSLAMAKAHRYPAERRCLLQYRCSLPVAGATGNFSRQQDPRLIEDGVLNSIYFNIGSFSDLGDSYETWMNLVEQLRVTTPCVFKIAYTTDRSISRISCETDAVAYL